MEALKVAVQDKKEESGTKQFSATKKLEISNSGTLAF